MHLIKINIPSLPKYLSNQQGFTLVELLVVTAIIAILAFMGMSAYSGLLDEYSVDQAVSQTITSFKEARYTAMAENRSVTVGFNQGTIVYDKDTTGVCGTCRNEIIDITGGSGSIGVSPTTERVFKSDGTVNPGTVTITGGKAHGSILLNVIGRSYEQ